MLSSSLKHDPFAPASTCSDPCTGTFEQLGFWCNGDPCMIGTGSSPFVCECETNSGKVAAVVVPCVVVPIFIVCCVLFFFVARRQAKAAEQSRVAPQPVSVTVVPGVPQTGAYQYNASPYGSQPQQPAPYYPQQPPPQGYYGQQPPPPLMQPYPPQQPPNYAAGYPPVAMGVEMMPPYASGAVTGYQMGPPPPPLPPPAPVYGAHSQPAAYAASPITKL